MRTLFVVAMTILVHNNVYAVDPEAHVFVRQPIVVLVRQFQLPQLCGTTRDVSACTATVGQRLSCSCERKSDGWSIEASAQFVPVMYVLGPERVLHERDHIADLDRALTEYVAALEHVRFESAEECQLKSRDAIATFPMTMNRFKDESNAARHPGYVRVTRPTATAESSTTSFPAVIANTEEVEPIAAADVGVSRLRRPAAAAGSFHITIVVIRLKSPADLLRACNVGPGRIYGCTHIVGEVLETECTKCGGTWTLLARGHARALMRVVDSDVITHELNHIREIADAANAITARAAAAEYRSRDECEAAAILLTSRFRAFLQEVARASQANRN